jgi:DNA topoisomerase-1
VRLIFVDDSLPGITRRMVRGAWAYVAPDGTRITDGEEVRRLNAIALPPAYRDAWFAPAPNAHILATGWDAKGRKQYRYHPDFRAEREALKFDGCAAFGRLLPLIRQRVESDLATRVCSLDRAIASVVRLLDTGGIRIGNKAYAQANKSFGATTLRMRHARLSGGTLHLSFKAKSGKQREMHVSDKGLVRFVKRMQDLPGQHLFQYVNAQGAPVPVNSADVNAYLRQTMGADFTAKHFRTWHASVLAFAALHDARADMPVKAVLAHVADRLGNTPAIARKSYIHPAVLACIEDQAALRAIPLPRRTRWLDRHERALIAFLEARPPALALLAA